MDLHPTLGLVAASGHLALAILVLTRSGRSPLAMPLALLCLDMFGWNLANVGYELSENKAWSTIDHVLSPLTPPLILHVVAAFVGRRRALRLPLIVCYGFFGLLSFFAVFDTHLWGQIFAVAELAVVPVALTWLVRHLRTTTDPAERSRAEVIIAAFAIAALCALTELIDMPVGIPRVANIGTLATTVLIAIVAMRWRLLGQEVLVGTALYALLLSVLTVLGAVAVFRAIGASTAVVVAGAVTLTAAVLVATRAVLAAYAVRRERITHLATVGRFSSQMAHDLRNPLATLKGALQFLREEHVRGRSLDGHHEYVDLMLDQVERLRRTVDNYERIGRVDPLRTALDMNNVVRAILSLQPFGAAPRVELHTVLADDLPTCDADADLVGNALENVVKNAIEAMPEGGTVTVRTARTASPTGDGVLVSVEDTGAGMDARELEHAFDDFFTTKVTGSGLGLAFVKRVVQAHGGSVSLEPRRGGGTVVRMQLPARST